MYDDIQLIMEREAGLPEHATPVGVGFGLHPRKNGAASEKAGRPVYDEVEYIKIITPGERNTIFHAPATDDHRRRFPKAYALFKAGAQAAEHGTPLAQWPQMTRGQCLSFAAIGIHTVEALAAVHDGNIEALGHGGRELREKARAYLKQAEDSALAQKLAAEKVEQQNQIRALQAQIADLAQRLEAKESTEKPAAPSRAERQRHLAQETTR